MKKVWWIEPGRVLGVRCPGCKAVHDLAIRPHRHENGASWAFDGDLEKPTITPSVVERVGPFPETSGSKYAGKTLVCHFFLREGVIQFLTDSTHALAGQTVTLPDLPAEP